MIGVPLGTKSIIVELIGSSWPPAADVHIELHSAADGMNIDVSSAITTRLADLLDGECHVGFVFPNSGNLNPLLKTMARIAVSGAAVVISGQISVDG